MGVRRMSSSTFDVCGGAGKDAVVTIMARFRRFVLDQSQRADGLRDRLALDPRADLLQAATRNLERSSNHETGRSTS